MGIENIISKYQRENITIATACSHSSLQIFNGARREGFKSIGVAIRERPTFYDAFPLGRPDEYIIVDSYKKINNYAEKLYAKNAVIVPHGSFVEYMGADNFLQLKIPTFGNKSVLKWESDRQKERQWLESAGITTPEIIDDARCIDKPVIVKYYGAKGGRGFFVAKDYED